MENKLLSTGNQTPSLGNRTKKPVALKRHKIEKLIQQVGTIIDVHLEIDPSGQKHKRYIIVFKKEENAGLESTSYLRLTEEQVKRHCANGVMGFFPSTKEKNVFMLYHLHDMIEHDLHILEAQIKVAQDTAKHGPGSVEAIRADAQCHTTRAKINNHLKTLKPPIREPKAAAELPISYTDLKSTVDEKIKIERAKKKDPDSEDDTDPNGRKEGGLKEGAVGSASSSEIDFYVQSPMPCGNAWMPDATNNPDLTASTHQPTDQLTKDHGSIITLEDGTSFKKFTPMTQCYFDENLRPETIKGTILDQNEIIVPKEFKAHMSQLCREIHDLFEKQVPKCMLFRNNWKDMMGGIDRTDWRFGWRACGVLMASAVMSDIYLIKNLVLLWHEFPDPLKLYSDPRRHNGQEDEILEFLSRIFAGMGNQRKGKNFYDTTIKLVEVTYAALFGEGPVDIEKMNGVRLIPDDLHKITMYPGLGRKSAIMIQFIVFQEEAGVAIDRHARRLAISFGLAHPMMNDDLVSHVLEAFLEQDCFNLFNTVAAEIGQVFSAVRLLPDSALFTTIKTQLVEIATKHGYGEEMLCLLQSFYI